MSTREILRDQWVEFFQSFTDDHNDWLVRIGLKGIKPKHNTQGHMTEKKQAGSSLITLPIACNAAFMLSPTPKGSRPSTCDMKSPTPFVKSPTLATLSAVCKARIPNSRLPTCCCNQSRPAAMSGI